MSNLDSSDVNKQSKEETKSDDLEVSVALSEISSVGGGATKQKGSLRISSSSERQYKFERAQKCLENAALVTKRIKEHRKATAELLGRPFEDEDSIDLSLDSSSVVSERTERSEYGTTPQLSVAEALSIPGISESLANTLKQKEILMEKIKHYKTIQQERNIKKPSHRRSVSNVDPNSSEVKQASTDQTTMREEAQVRVLQVKIRSMETTIMELQEKLSEKESLLEAKIKASTLLSDNMSKKERDALILLEDTRQQMLKMQENFISMENEWKEEKSKLISEVKSKTEKISSLEEANTILENERFNLSLNQTKIQEELIAKESEIEKLEKQIVSLSSSSFVTKPCDAKEEEEKGSLEIESMSELTKKIELLEQINLSIRQTNLELESRLASLSSDNKSQATPKKQIPSPSLGRKRGKSATRSSSKLKSPWSQFSETATDDSKQNQSSQPPSEELPPHEVMLQKINKQLLEKECLLSKHEEEIEKLKEKLREKESELQSIAKSTPSNQECLEDNSCKVETPLSTAAPQTLPSEITNSMTDLEKQLLLAQEQISSLTFELEAANKNMVKVKSAHKLQVKQLQKTIDSFSKISDANSEVIKLTAEVNQLQQKVVELEEDKGNLQLHLVDYDSGRFSESDLQRKLCELENLAEIRLKAISDLEAQKFELVQDLHVAQKTCSEMEDKLADLSQLQTDQVSSEIQTVQLEEQIDELTTKINHLEDMNATLESSISAINKAKGELALKLEHYVQENIFLSDKVEKMSAEKVSSAESIEIVESLTSQEKMEMEELDMESASKSEAALVVKPKKEESDDSEDIAKIQQDRNDLISKIDLFTQERHEVMSKLEFLKNENEELKYKIENLNQHGKDFESRMEALIGEKENLLKLNEDLNQQCHFLRQEYNSVVQEKVSLVKRASSDVTESGKELVDATMTDSLTQEDKTGEEKTQEEKTNIKANKSAKQLTKDILKLKNIIKEREAEIADCHMKILSLEEQIQKQQETLKKTLASEKALTEERNKLEQMLKDVNVSTQVDQVEVDKLNQEICNLRHANATLTENMTQIQLEYQQAIASRDNKIQELELVALEGQKTLSSYNEALIQKSNDIANYLNQINQLNIVAQKLKSTIEVLEEEKANDQNEELIKNLNNQIIMLQNVISENDSKISKYEDDLVKVTLIKSELEAKIFEKEKEVNVSNTKLAEYEKVIKDLQDAKIKDEEDIFKYKEKCKEKDEEIHEIKLQLRKESIEYDSLRKSIEDIEEEKSSYANQINDLSQKLAELENVNTDLTDNLSKMEIKNKELVDKLKKYAVNLKKKATMCIELESQLKKNKLEYQNEQVKTVDDSETAKLLQDEVIKLKEELNHVKSGILKNEQQHAANLDKQIEEYSTKLSLSYNDLQRSHQEIEKLTSELDKSKSQEILLQNELARVNADLAIHEKYRNSSEEAQSKIVILEKEVYDKQSKLNDLQTQLEDVHDELKHLKFGQEAKLQESALYIETLQSEISHYKLRIERLEESISVMEDSRRSLERKADVLGDQLYEKQKAYSEYIYNEDELINRLGMLMEHDKVVEKQLQVIENENLELQMKNQKLTEENEIVKRDISQLQAMNSQLSTEVAMLQQCDAEVMNLKQNIEFLDAQLKKTTVDFENAVKKHQDEMKSLEQEFHNQIDETVKEKKSLLEKCEILSEKRDELNREIEEYAQKFKALLADYEYLRLEKEALVADKDNAGIISNNQIATESYISEINYLQTVITQLNHDKEQFEAVKLNYEHNIQKINSELISKQNAIDELKNSEINLISQNENLLKTLLDKEKEISQITSNIKNVETVAEPISLKQYFAASEDTHAFDLSTIQTQIINPEMLKNENESQNKPKQSVDTDSIKKFDQMIQSGSKEIVENVIVPKKAYECFPTNEGDIDPFNSDDGWGLGGDHTEDVKHDSEVNNFKAQIKDLTEENKQLKLELNTVNIKLAKAMKKLKELKVANDVLTNEVKLAKQMSQFGSLDSAIEDELKKQVSDLEDKIKDLENTMVKESSEKKAILKQNEVLKNGNDRFLEIKEKLENDLELWKFKFKEANDKVNNLEWGEENQATKVQISTAKSSESAVIEQIEKENTEYSLLVDQLNSQINEYMKEKEDLVKQIAVLSEEKDLIQEKLQASDMRLELLTEFKTNEEKLAKLTLDNDAFKIQIDELLRERDQLYQRLEECSKIQNAYDQLETLKNEYENSLKTISELESKLQIASKELENAQSELKNLEENCLKLNQENDNLLSTVTDLRSSISSSVDQRGCEVAEMWKNHLAQIEKDFYDRETDLKSQLMAAEQRYESMLDSMQSSTQEETSKMIMTEQLSSLQQKLKDKEEHLSSLQNQYSDAVNQLSLLRSEVEDEKVMFENKILNQQEENEKVLLRKDKEIEELSSNIETAEVAIKNLQTENESLLEKYHQAQQTIDDLKEQLENKDREISQKQHDLSTVLAQQNEHFENLRQEFLQSEKKKEALIYEKESELAIMRLKLHDSKTKHENDKSSIEKEKEDILEELQAKILECTNLNKTLVEYNRALEENSKQMSDMRVAMESQELDIVSLKDELERLASFKEKHVSFSSDTKFSSELNLNRADVPSDELIPRTELDLALYMLHQRDVRCEELTVELTQLLEERDTLQLRLSDCLRAQEDLRQRCHKSGLSEDDVDASVHLLTPIETTHRPTRSSFSEKDDGQLQTKLSQLRGVKQNRDVTLREDSEQRQRQMELLQRDVANLPPEAAQQLRQAHHTITHDAQSTSTVLINWLRGKTTPKVVHM